jgi:hypothetical protein
VSHILLARPHHLDRDIAGLLRDRGRINDVIVVETTAKAAAAWVMWIVILSFVTPRAFWISVKAPLAPMSGRWVGAQTSTVPSAFAWAVQFIGSSGAWTRNG